MIFSKECAMQQVTRLLHQYNGLRISNMDETEISLAGHILVNRVAKGYWLYKEYQVEIVIPLASDDLPNVKDAGNHIDKSYPHRYANRELCLETDTNIKIRFIDGFDLNAWMSEYVETYFFTYEFYIRYGEFPFGERAHGIEGIIQTYGELFHEVDYGKVLKILESIANHKYRGHSLCPCGSALKFRSCHGKFAMKYYTDDRLKLIVQKDYIAIMEVLEKTYEQQRNMFKTKPR